MVAARRSLMTGSITFQGKPRLTGADPCSIPQVITRHNAKKIARKPAGRIGRCARYFCPMRIGGRIRSGWIKDPVRNRRNEDSPGFDGFIDAYNWARTIPAINGTRH
jgi:hypothetical protein